MAALVRLAVERKLIYCCRDTGGARRIRLSSNTNDLYLTIRVKRTKRGCQTHSGSEV